MHIWRRKAPFRFNARLIVARLAERLASGQTFAAHAKASTLGHASRHALHVLPHMQAARSTLYFRHTAVHTQPQG
jgi:hypothetical protein